MLDPSMSNAERPSSQGFSDNLSSAMNSSSQASAAAMLRAAQQGQGSPSLTLAQNSVAAAMLQQQQLSQGISQQANGQQGGDQQSQQQQQALTLSNELKRIQQLHQLGGAAGAPSNALLMPGQQRSADPSAAFLQMLESQKLQTPRFDTSLQQSLAQPGQNPMMHPGFLQDARFFMAQTQLNPNMATTAAMQNDMSDVPLPSPHSLFHRDGSRRMRGGVIEPFPEKLHRLLIEVEGAGRSDVISFVAGGRAFAIHKPDKFFKEIVPLYFRQSRLSSFKRQLNLYGFELINTGPARGGYYHELFVKDRPELCRRMRRVAIKVSSKHDSSKDKDTDTGVTKDPETQGETQQETHDNLHGEVNKMLNQDEGAVPGDEEVHPHLAI